MVLNFLYIANLNSKMRAVKSCIYITTKVPGFAKISIRSISRLRAATASARHPPKDSPTRYMGLFGDRSYSDLTVFSTNFTRSATGNKQNNKLCWNTDHIYKFCK